MKKSYFCLGALDTMPYLCNEDKCVGCDLEELKLAKS